MPTIKMFISIFIILFFLCSCSLENNKNVDVSEQIALDSKDFKKRIESTAARDQLPMALNGGKGIGLNLYKTDGQIESKHVFKINLNEKWEKFISISHKLNEERIYKLILFVDYKQEDFYVDGEEVRNYTFKMEPNETLEIPVGIKQLSTGLHDAFFVLVKFPDIKSLDKDFRMETAVNNLLFIRFNIIVENDSIKEIPLTKNFEISKDDSFNGFMYNKKKNNTTVWYFDDININTQLEYFYHIGNVTGKSSRRYAIIALLDWEQVELNEDGDKVLFFEVEKNTKITIPALLQIPKQEGVYDLCPILISNPFDKLDIDNRGIGYSVRVGIKVRDN